ncbi:MAG TPA: hypothetical protein VL358_05405 [Caulobacteraceae bacterium]|nr:hypothetical protein [Caulobacteraceae bacterium]
MAERLRQQCGCGRVSFALSNALRNLGLPCAERPGAQPSRENPEAIAADLQRAFSATTTRRRHLCPLDLADDLPVLSFGLVRISSFTAEQLEGLFDTERLGRVYPGRSVDFARLAQVQWLVLEEEVAIDPRPEARAIPIFFQRMDQDFGAFDPLARRYPELVEEAVFCLLLAPWEAWGTMTPVDWRGFHLPWVYTVDTDLAIQPAAPPDAASLTFEPTIYHGQDGEDIEDEQPSVLQLDGDDLQGLAEGLAEAWRKLETARITDLFQTPIEHFMVRAHASTGIDELLAHMTVLEAALGEEADHDRKLRPKPQRNLSATERMARKVAGLLNDPAAAQAYRDLFRIRSLFVHGRAGLTTISTDQKIMARRLARRVANALLDCASSSPPTRSVLLTQLLAHHLPCQPHSSIWARF